MGEQAVIGIILLTYERLDYALRALCSVNDNLVTDEPLWLHIADDGSSQEYRDTLFGVAHDYFGDNVSMSNSERGGYGANYNAATQAIHAFCDLLLPLEDDWELTRPLNLEPIVGVLRDGIFGCVRMGYVGATQDLRGTFVSSQNLWWLRLDPDSPEPHVFAGHPRLEHREWQRKVGPWPEGMEAGATEFVVAHIREARQDVAWPVSIINPMGDAFAHIGTHRADNSNLRLQPEVT